MNFKIEYSDKAKKFLKKSDKDLSKRIMDKLETLRTNPVPSDSKFYGRNKDDKVFRYRIGKYRVLYIMDEKNKIILITKIGKRFGVYD